MSVFPLRAALPPYWQRAAELKAILESQEVSELLKSKPVDRVERRSNDQYRVQAGSCRLDVRIVGEEQTMPGPRKFKLEPGKLNCR